MNEEEFKIPSMINSSESEIEECLLEDLRGVRLRQRDCLAGGMIIIIPTIIATFIVAGLTILAVLVAPSP